MEAHLGVTYPVLDKGFIRVMDYMGRDEDIDDAARTSYGEGTRSVSDTRTLIRYLFRHRHTGPFEMCEIKLFLKMPLFVARQWIRHRTASINEYSGRYSIMPEEFYIPPLDAIGQQARNNKQGRSGQMDDLEGTAIQNLMSKSFETDKALYGRFIDVNNMARELARTVLPLATFTQFYWKIDARNLFHFLGLRMEETAQREMREYANPLGGIVRDWLPIAYEAFVDYQFEAHTFSRQELEVLRHLIAHVYETDLPSDRELLSEGMTKREVAVFKKVLGLQNAA